MRSVLYNGGVGREAHNDGWSVPRKEGGGGSAPLSRMAVVVPTTIEPRIPTMPGRSTPGFQRWSAICSLLISQQPQQCPPALRPPLVVCGLVRYLESDWGDSCRKIDPGLCSTCAESLLAAPFPVVPRSSIRSFPIVPVHFYSFPGNFFALSLSLVLLSFEHTARLLIVFDGR